MEQILTFLMNHFSFLYEDLDCRFADSCVSKSFGGDASLILTAKHIRLRFIVERGQLFLDIQGDQDRGEGSWFSIDIIRQFVTGKTDDRAELNAGDADFIQKNFSLLEDAFSPQRISATRDRLKELERARAKRLFG